MREDQIERLKTLAEDIGEVFLEEADPNTWSGAGMPLSAMSKDDRGGRYWDKKNAIQTGTLLARVLDLTDRHNGLLGPNFIVSEEDAEKDIKKYESKAKDLLKGIQDRARTA